MIHVLCSGEHVVALGEETTDGWEELRAGFLGQLGVERVDGDVDGAAVGLEFEDGVHHGCGGLAEGGAEGVKVLEVGFVHCVADDFDVEVVEVVGGETAAEVRG